MHLRAGRRLRAARRYGLAVRHGRRSAWRLAAASLVAPSWAVERLRDRRRVHLPADWVDEAEAWLAPLRTHDAVAARRPAPACAVARRPVTL
jgi:hypothetical protein